MGYLPGIDFEIVKDEDRKFLWSLVRIRRNEQGKDTNRTVISQTTAKNHQQAVANFRKDGRLRSDIRIAEYLTDVHTLGSSTRDEIIEGWNDPE